MHQTPAPLIGTMFTKWADDLENGTVAATNPVLTDAFKGTIAGLRSAAATSEAFKDGTLDLRPDLAVVYEESQKVADYCSDADESGKKYVAIVNAG